MLDFPSSPIVGEVFPSPALPGIPQWEWDGVRWVDYGTPTGVEISSSPPFDPIDGQLWFDTNTEMLNVFDGVDWAPAFPDAPHDNDLYGRVSGRWEPFEWTLDGGEY